MLRAPLVLSKTRLESLSEVVNLNLWGNELTDVSLLSTMPNLEIISLSINQIDTLSTFAHCPKLKEIYLRKNRVQDVAEVVFLQGLRQLHTLWLSDNPCADESLEEGPWYRPFVLRILPQLRKLDNVMVTAEERAVALATNNAVLHAMHTRAQYLSHRRENPVSKAQYSSKEHNSSSSRSAATGLSDSVSDRSYIHMEGRDLNVVDIELDPRLGERRPPVPHTSSSSSPQSPHRNHRNHRQPPRQQPPAHRSPPVPRPLSPRSQDVERMVDLRESQTNPLDFLGDSNQEHNTGRRHLNSGKSSDGGNGGKGSSGTGESRREETKSGDRPGFSGVEEDEGDLDSASALAVATLLLQRMNQRDLSSLALRLKKVMLKK